VTEASDGRHRVERVTEAGYWVVYLVDAVTGDRVGLTFRGATEAEAVARLQRWTAWQRDHDAAFRRLQAAVREYYRAETQGGLTAVHEDMADDERRLTALEQLDRARLELDAVRRRRPG
jgi:hypothetical protein